MAYTVYFENLPTATTTTRAVTVTDPFDTDLDIRSFRLGQIVFGRYTVIVPQNRSFYQTRLPLTDQGSNIVADISAGIDVATGAAKWTITAIDLNTGLQPLDPNAGLLPPDTTNGIGQGYVTYTISPVEGSASGTVITNQAVIVFEDNAPINTPITTNVLDAFPPTSLVTALGPVTLGTNIYLTWSGEDDTNGIGISSYKVFASDNGGAYSLWYDGSTNTLSNIVTSGVFSGIAGHTYSFISQAKDFAANVEPFHTNADATTLLSANRSPVLPTLPDQNINVGSGFNITNAITDPGSSGALVGVSVIGAPPGVTAKVNGTNIVLRWSPTAFQAGTTNLIQLVITNNGVPPLTTTQTFLVVIADYAAPSLGVAAGQPGGGVCLPMNLFTSTGLSNIQFVVDVPASTFTNWGITLLSPALCGGTVQSLSPTQLLVKLNTCAGTNLLVADQTIAQLCLNVNTNLPSQFVPIPISAVQATRPDSSLIGSTGSHAGKVVIVADQPLLDIQSTSQGAATLTLYGVPNFTNIVQSSTNIASPTNSWQPIWQNRVTNLANPMPVQTGSNAFEFFRAVIPKP